MSLLFWYLLTAGLLAAADHKAPTTMLKTEHYEALKDALIQGDIIYAFAVRNPEPGEPPPPDAQGRRFRNTVWNDSNFSQRIEALNAIHDPRLEKMVVLSSILDLQANLKRPPKDLRWVAYNTEPAMTPAEELLNLEKSVAAFARICHDNGLKLSWVPSNFRMFDSETKLSGFAPYVDTIVLQHQRDLQDSGVDTFIDLTKRRAALIRKINPKCRADVQVVIGRGSKEDLIRGLRAVSGDVDGADIWTMQEPGIAREILKAVR